MNHPASSDARQLADVLMEIASNFINVPLEKTEEVISRSLGILGEFTDTDRAYVFKYDHQDKTCSNTHEWCRDGIEPQIQELQNVPLEVIPDWVSTHLRGETMLIEDVTALDPSSGVRQILEPQSIKSLIAIPMMSKGTCIGFVGFDSVKHHQHYSEKEQKLLQLFAMMLVNLNDRIQTQTQLNKAIENAEAANQAKSDFLANITHEIRTPLHSIVGYTDLLMDTPLSEQQLDYLNNAKLSTKILMGIINDVLDFSKMEAGKMPLIMASADLQLILSNCLQVVQLAAKQKDLPIHLQIDPQTPRFIFTDLIRLQQVVTNLLSNAVKFTETGSITLTTQYQPTSESGGTLRFSIQDTGIGITEEQKKNLFKPFMQGDTSITRRYGGTGLGLIISEMIVNQMGSKIELDNSRSSGTTFYFELLIQTASDEKME